MICNHEFVAQYRGIFARFSPTWHYPGVKSKTPEKKRKRFSGVQALAAQKLVPNLRLGQPRRSIEIPSVEHHTRLGKKRKFYTLNAIRLRNILAAIWEKSVFFKTNSSKKTRKRDATKDWTILSERRLTSNPLRKLRRPSFLPNHKSNAEGFAKEPA